MAARTITLTTDFGSDSPYVAQMKGVIYGLDPEARIVDITHKIQPQDIEQASWVLVDVAEAFAPDSIHVVVVDPGVGSQRSLLSARFSCGTYIAPDNGVLSRLAERHELRQLIELNQPRFWRCRVTSTFHGRDCMAPVAAHLSLGQAAHDMGEVRSSWHRIPWPAVKSSVSEVAGHVRGIDSFGNLVSDIHRDDLRHLTDLGRARIACGEHSVAGVSDHYAQRQPGELVAVIGSCDFLELALVGGNAARHLPAERGAEVIVSR